MKKFLGMLMVVALALVASAADELVLFGNGKSDYKLFGAKPGMVGEKSGVLDWSGAAKGGSMGITGFPADQTGVTALEFTIYSPSADNGTIMVTLDSNAAGTKGNYYFKKVPLDFVGWKTITIPVKEFGVSRSPAGWALIERVGFFAKGWGLEPKATQLLGVESVKLVK